MNRKCFKKIQHSGWKRDYARRVGSFSRQIGLQNSAAEPTLLFETEIAKKYPAGNVSSNCHVKTRHPISKHGKTVEIDVSRHKNLPGMSRNTFKT